MIIRQVYEPEAYWFVNHAAKLMANQKHGADRVWSHLETAPCMQKVCELLSIPDEAVPIHFLHSHGCQRSLYKVRENYMVRILLTAHRIDLFLAGDNLEFLEEKIEAVNQYAQQLRATADDKVGITFAYLTNQGPRYYYRNIVCPRWASVKKNYPNSTTIEWLLALDEPLDYGKLVFWHGKPGTGKTYMIRALMSEWKDKADFFYILDPENLFGKAGYLVETLLQRPERPEPEVTSASAPYEGAVKERLKVFIIEDALDLLLAENRKDMSTAMARLLNLTEGIVGQGFKVLVLITSNEQVKAIDPAFIRAGRCLQVLEYEPFTREQGREWLESHGTFLKTTDISKEEWTLADLYAKLRPQMPKGVSSHKEVGFKVR